MYLKNGAPVSFTNCLFHGNKAGGGGALAKASGSLAIFNNCTLANNQATMVRGGAIRDDTGAVTISNSILWGNTRLDDPDGPGGSPPTAVPD